MPWPGERMLARARIAWARPSTAGGPIFAAEIPSSTTEAECRCLAELARGRRVLEIGSYFGRSTVALASTAALVHTIDVHPADEVGGDTLTALIANLDRYDLRHKVVVLAGFSQLILPQLNPGSFDLAFLDGQHQRDPVEEDLAALLPLVHPRGVIAFHDYGVPGVEHRGVWDDFAVTEVVNSFVRERRLRFDVTDTLAVVHLS
jgi:predicted O-methyltransferase YrrM